MAGVQAAARGVPRDEITKYLVAWSAGDPRAASPAFAALYATLRRLARRALSGERSEHTLGTTGLIGEAFFRLLEQQRIEWRSREHFIATAAQMMRRILIDHARGRSTVKRGGGAAAVPLDEAAPLPVDALDGLVAIHDALEALSEVDRMQSQIVELRFFGGMTHEEIALYLGVSAATIERRWRLARAWLYRRLKDTVT
jgi:RNA polymerase sigma-70 factor, ECF subfamily